MALTATCTKDARDTIEMQLCMEGAEHISHSADRPNIFLSTKLMPNKVGDWCPFLDKDATLLKTLGVNVERKMFFCRTITMMMYLDLVLTLTPRESWYHQIESLSCIIWSQQSR